MVVIFLLPWCFLVNTKQSKQLRWKQKCTVALALYQDSFLQRKLSGVNLKPDKGSRFESVSFITSSKTSHNIKIINVFKSIP